MSLVKSELEKKNTDFNELQGVLHGKEMELAHAKLDIQHLKSETESIFIDLEEKDSQLLQEMKKLHEVNQEIAELRMLMSGKEVQLVETTTLLKEKEEQVEFMQTELDDTGFKVAEAVTVMKRIVDHTNKMVVSSKKEEGGALHQCDNSILESLHRQPSHIQSADFALRNRQLESLGIERELSILKEETVEDNNDPRKLYALAQERNGELGIERLQVEAEAATGELEKLTEMSRQLLSNGIEADDTEMLRHDSLKEVGMGVIRLAALTGHLVKQAGLGPA
ncbi:hypothetical protein LINPERPRIM_LOCUS33433 [Linum perenne]